MNHGEEEEKEEDVISRKGAQLGRVSTAT